MSSTAHANIYSVPSVPVIVCVIAVLQIASLETACGDERDTVVAEIRARSRDIRTLRHARKFDEALRLAKQNLAVAKRAFPDTEDIWGPRHHDLALTYLAAGGYDKARQIWEEQLAWIAGVARGGDRAGSAYCLGGLADCYLAQGNFKKAQDSIREAIRILDATGWKDEGLLIDLEFGLAKAHYLASDFLAAEPIARRVLARANNLYGDTDRTIDARRLLAELTGKRERGDDVNAKPRQGMALRLARKFDSSVTNDGRNTVAEIPAERIRRNEIKAREGEIVARRHALKHDEALRLAKQNVAVAERSFPDTPDVLAPAYGQVGRTYLEMGEHDQAEPLFQQQLALYEQHWGEDAAEAAFPLQGLATIHASRHEFGKAKGLLEQAIRIRRAAIGKQDELIIWLEYELAGTLGLALDHSAAEPLARSVLARAENAYGDTGLTIDVRHLLANLVGDLGRRDESLEIIEGSVKIIEQPGFDDIGRQLKIWGQLALAYRLDGRLNLAAELSEKVLRHKRQAFGPSHPSTVSAMIDLGQLYSTQGHLYLAEPLYRRAIRIIEEKNSSSTDVDLVPCLSSLADLYNKQGKYEEAVALYERVIGIHVSSKGVRTPLIIRPLTRLASIQLHLYEAPVAAEKNASQALTLAQEIHSPEDPSVAAALEVLGHLRLQHGRSEDALNYFQQAVAISNISDSVRQNCLHGAARCLLELDRYAEAVEMENQAIESTESRDSLDAQNLIHSLGYRAEANWKLGRKQDAIRDLSRALELVDKQRMLTAGDAWDRSEFDSSFRTIYVRLAAYQASLGNLEAAMNAVERSSARTLIDQINAQRLRSDIREGADDDFNALLKHERLAASRIAGLRQRHRALSQNEHLAPEDRQNQQQDIRDEMAAAEQEAIEAYRAARNADPAARLVAGSGFKPAALDAVRAWVDREEALLLRFVIDDASWGSAEGSTHVFEVAAGSTPRMHNLTLTDEQAKQLGTEPGPLTAKQLAQALQVNGKSLHQHFATANVGRAVIDRLASLYRVLIPEAQRQAIDSGQYKRLIVIPDGILSTLPFETLVVETEDPTRYLLDVAPPIVYGPSVTVLYNLVARETAPKDTVNYPVLTIADPDYRGRGLRVQDLDTGAMLTGRGQFTATGGRLHRLPFTDTESKWVSEAFSSAGLDTIHLRQDAATEAAFRRFASNRRVLHIACHGLVDGSHGNLFGNLALTVGPDPADAGDDGFLTLSEIYELDLTGNELAVLSACDTNYGPRQPGEGIMALSRGFLVAGSRRVVASNWLLDDEAAASIVGFFCSIVAKAESAGEQPDYADALQQAKRWARGQDKWENPYYWGTLVLVGPN